MSNSIAPGSSADVNVKVTALTTNPNVPAQYKTIILKKNLVNGVNTLTQEMMSAANTKYVVKYDYVLAEDITVPENCILEFDGGSVSGAYTLTGNNTGINAQDATIFNNVSVTGISNTEIKAVWFGLVLNSSTYDNHNAIMKAINCAYTSGINRIIFPTGNIYTSCISLQGYQNITLIGQTPFKESGDFSTNGTHIIALSSDNNYCLLQFSDANMSGWATPWNCRSSLVKDITLNGNNIVDHCINGNYCLKIDTCTIKGAVVSGVKMENYTYPFDIVDCSIIYNTNGIISDGPMTTIFNIQNCEISNNTECGIIVYNGASAIIDNCTVQSNGKEGVKIFRKNIEGNYFLSNITFNNLYLESNASNASYSITIDSEEHSMNYNKRPLNIMFKGGMCTGKGIAIYCAAFVTVGLFIGDLSNSYVNTDTRYVSGIEFKNTDTFTDIIFPAMGSRLVNTHNTIPFIKYNGGVLGNRRGRVCQAEFSLDLSADETKYMIPIGHEYPHVYLPIPSMGSSLLESVFYRLSSNSGQGNTNKIYAGTLTIEILYASVNDVQRFVIGGWDSNFVVVKTLTMSATDTSINSHSDLLDIKLHADNWDTALSCIAIRVTTSADYVAGSVKASDNITVYQDNTLKALLMYEC